MKRNILSIAFVLAASIGLNAAPITRGQAAKTAERFVVGRSLMYGNSRTITAIKSEEIKPYYVFNIGENNGFVIVAGDDSVDPIIGYSYEGHFDAGNMPENLKFFMKCCETKISAIQKKNLPAKALVRKNAEEKKRIPVMLKSKWNQYIPFNDLCPDFGEGKSVTGCVATAMAQVMNYHQWPAYEIPEIPSYKMFEGDKEKEKIIDALPAIKFDWEGAAIEHIGIPAFDKAAAEICRYAGQACKSDYTVQATGSNNFDMIRGLKNHLEYSNTMIAISRSHIQSEEEWNNICYNELASKRPFIIGGSGAGQGSGHEFVCDGYENGKYHINWGWGGMADGFYDIENMNPSDAGIGGDSGVNYSDNYSIILNVIPNGHDFFVFSEPVTIVPGTEQKVDLKFNCYEDRYTSVQFDVSLPKGITLVNNSSGKPYTLNTSGDHKVEYNMLPDGDYRFIITSASNSVLKMSENNLLSLDIAVAPDAKIDNNTFIITKNGVVCNTMYTGFDFKPYHISLKLTEDPSMGDINEDGIIDQYDIDGLRNCIMKGKFYDVDKKRIDMDNDGDIDIADLALLINKVKGIEGKETFFEPTINEGKVIISDQKIVDSEQKNCTYLFPEMVNEPLAKAVQFNVKFVNGGKITNIWSDPSERTAKKNFWNYYQYIGDHTYRIIIYDTEGENIDDHFDFISGMTIESSKPLETEYSDIIIVTTDFKKIKVNNSNEVPMGIEEINGGYSINDNRIYTLEGVYAGNDRNKLPEGVYIVNGRKVLIK